MVNFEVKSAILTAAAGQIISFKRENKKNNYPHDFVHSSLTKSDLSHYIQKQKKEKIVVLNKFSSIQFSVQQVSP